MKTRILKGFIVACLTVGVFVTGQLVRIHQDAPKKLGLPGGGHNCCWRPGYSTVSRPDCPSPPVGITQQNVHSVCSCAPAQLWC